MQDLPKIRTPLRQQWRRIRYQLIPVLSLGCCVLLTGWIWSRRTATVDTWGEVAAIQSVAYCQRDGVIVPLPPALRWRQYESEIGQGQTIALLDPQPLQAALRVMQAEVDRLRLDLAAQEDQLKIDQQVREHDYLAEARRLAVQIEMIRLNMLDRRALLETDQIDLRQQKAILEAITSTGAASSSLERLEAQLRHDVLTKRILGAEKALTEAEDQLAKARKRAEAHQPIAADLSRQLAPFVAAIDKQIAAFEQLKLEHAQLEVKAPIAGRIVAVHRIPGQVVRAGDPIVTIASEEGRYIVTYVRQDQGLRPIENLTVELRPRNQNIKSTDSFIQRVGPQVESVPSHQLRDPMRPEWGVPVLIAMPDSLRPVLRPGELVGIRYKAESLPATNK